MTTDLSPVPAHSVAEAYLYLKVARCPACGRGGLRADGELTRARDDWEISCACTACRKRVTIHFDIQPVPTREAAQSSVINPTPKPSRAIDLLGWLQLFQQIATAAGREKDKTLGRELAIEAARCLDEALKFYDGDNELPAPSAFFTAEGKTALRQHPQRFARSIWLQRRAKLPQAREAGADSATNPRKAKRRWWPFGGGRG